LNEPYLVHIDGLKTIMSIISCHNVNISYYKPQCSIVFLHKYRLDVFIQKLRSLLPWLLSKYIFNHLFKAILQILLRCKIQWTKCINADPHTYEESIIYAPMKYGRIDSSQFYINDASTHKVYASMQKILQTMLDQT